MVFEIFQFYLIFISVDRNNSREIFVLHCNFMTGLLAVEARLKVQQCTVPATEISNACDCNRIFSLKPILSKPTLILGIQIIPAMKTRWREELFAWDS